MWWSPCETIGRWRAKPLNPNVVEGAFYELRRFYEVAPALVTPSYLSWLYNVRWDRRVPPSRYRRWALDELARGLASGNPSRRNALYATGGCRAVLERLQQNAGETEPSRGGNQCLNHRLLRQ